MDPNIQHAQLVMGLALVAAAGGTFAFAICERWIGGVWATLTAITVAGILVYPSLVGGSVFARVATDIPQRILVGSIPFTVVLILLSFQVVPWIARLIFATVGPSAFLGWVFLHSHGQVAMPDYTLHHILPIAVVVLIAWLLIEPIALRSPGIAAPLLVGATTGGIAVLLLISIEKMVLDAVIPATAAGAVCAALIAGVLKWKISFARGPVLLWLTVMSAFFAFMWFDAETLYQPYLLWIGAALPLAWIPEIRPLRQIKPWKRELLRAVLVLIPVVIGSGLAYRSADQAGEMDGMVWPVPQSAAPICPSQMPMPNTINPPTIT